ncbi:MAG: Ribosomal large subunit pseudouridine synthase B [Chlamydiae bacterium]|nr:Ribosomal large subunit pseudouridine synthase B [Chlamydiota bacterium]
MNRLSKVLAAAGVASRRGSEKLIFDGKVRVNDMVITIPQTLVDPDSDRILVDDHPIKSREEKVYYILNKPRGYTCSNTRIGRKKLVIDLFEGMQKRLFTIGRLDRDTTGLLLITNDGHFAQDVIHPSNNLTKEYLVKTKQEITHEHLQALSKGTLIEGKWIKPIKVKKMRRGTIKVGVREGKKREVRLMVQNAGLDLLTLSRIRIGGLKLGALDEGEWRELSKIERKLIFS